MISAAAAKTVRGYELHDIIGTGGFGAVYRAFQPIVDREVAIKVILPQFTNQPEFVRNFESEARLIARLEHPFIVPIFDYWRDPDGAYLVMRYLTGGSLRGLLKKQGALPPAQVATMLAQVAGALDTAHRHQVIHRDIKPENILLDLEQNAYLADFGIAKNLEDTSQPEPESFSGTLAYAAPEMLRDEPATALSDLYSLGYVVYEMLTGHHAFDNDSPMLLVMSHMEQDIPPITDLPLAVNEVLRKATAKDPQDRFPTAPLLAKAFAEAIQQQMTVNLVDDLLSEVINPYKGLRPFEEADAADFFGREHLIDQLLAHFKQPEDRFLAVVGPSGSGKSSVVLAGLLPALRAGKIPGSENWFIVTMVPGTRPLQQLKTALLSVAIDPNDTLSGKLQGGRAGLLEAMETVLNLDHPLLLVIDQFEEVFTLLEDETERQHFLDLLHTALVAPNSPLKLIITLRADFYDRPLLYEHFGGLVQAHTQVVLPLKAEELEQAITGPARRVGMEVETDLVAAIVTDVRQEPGALPLLQYALTEVFEQREGKSLNLAAYQKSGGVLGALARRAEEVFKELSPEHQQIAQQIFLRLVAPGEGTEDTRRRARYSELMAVGTDRARVQAVLDAYGKYRLLTFDNDTETREPTIEVAHEALIREWERLRRWLDSSRQDIRLQRLLAAATADWQQARQEDSYLLSGARLAQFEEWMGRTHLALTGEEATFLRASIARRQQQAEAEAARQANELALEKRARRRLQQVIGVLSAASVVGIILTLLILYQFSIAQDERDRAQQAEAEAEAQAAIADQNALEARSLALSTSAQQIFSDGDTVLGLTLALAAVEIENPPQEAYDTLTDVAFAAGVRYRVNVFGENESVAIAEISPDGQQVLLAAGAPSNNNAGTPQGPGGPGGQQPPPGGQRPPGAGGQQPPPGGGQAAQTEPAAPIDTSVKLLDLTTREVVQTFTGHQANVTDALFMPVNNVTYVVSADQDGNVIIWDSATGETLQRLRRLSPGTIQLSATRDGRYLLVTGLTANGGRGHHFIWDIEAAKMLGSYPAHEVAGATLVSSEINPDSSKGNAVSAYSDGGQLVWDFLTGEEVLRVTDLPLDQGLRQDSYYTTISPDGEQALTNTGEPNAILWNLENGTVTGIMQTTEAVDTRRAVFNADGSRLLLASRGGEMSLWDVEGNFLLEHLSNQAQGLGGVAISADGQMAVVGSNAGQVTVWSLEEPPFMQIENLNEYGQHLAVIPNSDPVQVLTFGAQPLGTNVAVSELLLWEIDQNGGELLRVLGEREGRPGGMAVTPDGRYVLVRMEGQPGTPPEPSVLWEVASGAIVQEIAPTNPPIRRLVFTPTDLIALVQHGPFLRLWNVETGETVREYTGFSGELVGLALSVDGQYVAAGTRDNQLCVWEIESTTPLQCSTLEYPPQMIQFSPQGQYLATSQDQDVATFTDVWDTLGRTSLYRLEGKLLSFSSDDRYVATTNRDSGLIIWDVTQETTVNQLDYYDARLRYVTFSADEQAMLVISDGSPMILWQTVRPSFEDIRAWITANRYIRELTPLECERYRLQAQCEVAGQGAE